MRKRLVVILVNTDPRNGEELGAPFYHAAVAAALDHEVDIICTATAGRLLRRGVAETLFVKPGSSRSVLDFIRDAHQAGARLWACPANLDLFDMSAADLIEECSGLMGVAAMMEIVMADDVRVLSY